MGKKNNVVRNGQLVVENGKSVRYKANLTHPACRPSSSDVSSFEVSAGRSSTSDPRYRYEDFHAFEADLKHYNKSLRRNVIYKNDGDISDDVKSYFTCVGFANVRLRFCTCCNDEDKQETSDMYFVDKYDIAQRRKVLCYGCLGSILKEMKTS